MDAKAERPLKGRSAWLITDGKIGMDVQVRGVADAVGLNYAFKTVAPRQPFRSLSPWGPVDPRERFGQPGNAFAPPFPDFALATGRLSIPYLRALRRRAGFRTFCIILQDPKTGDASADLIWVPEHDKRRGPHVVTTLTAPHSFTAARLADLRRSVPAEIAALPRPRLAVVLGGPNAIYDYGTAALDQLERSLAELCRHVGSVMVTPSRRTPPEMLNATRRAIGDKPNLIWNGTGANPYPQILAHADLFVVTADSVNMTGEACATGKPVYVFEPGAGSAKFARFHASLRRHGATRPLPETLSRIEGWTYRPLDSAQDIASEIERRWLARKAALPGLMPD
jgi:mitochondrial fission protein ELM1